MLGHRRPRRCLWDGSRADALAQRAADLKKLTAAWQPLYQTLMPDQKRRLGLLAVIAMRELRDRAECRMQAADDDEEIKAGSNVAVPGIRAQQETIRRRKAKLWPRVIHL
jgi:hypothetical protein